MPVGGLFCLLFIWFPNYSLWKLYLDRLEGYSVKLLLFQPIFNFSMSPHGLEALFCILSFWLQFCQFCRGVGFFVFFFFLNWSFALPFLLPFSFRCILSSSSSSLISGLPFCYPWLENQLFLWTENWHALPFSLTLDLAFLMSFIFTKSYSACFLGIAAFWPVVALKGFIIPFTIQNFWTWQTTFFCIISISLVFWAQALWV